ncbi:MAG: ABC transporter permease [Gammaproteobacteria bacterium]|nr:ABC transporter permease [Gammaproteobacteria bacterium]
MLKILVRRLVSALFTLAFVAVVVFAVAEALPGDACTAYLGRLAQGERLDNCRASLDLDQPAAKRFVHWARDLAQGDLGNSLKRKKPIEEIVGPRFRNTVILGTVAALIGIPLAIVLGVFAGVYRDKIPDFVISGVSLLAMTIPEFVIATLLIFVFAISFQWFPAVTILPTDAGIREILPNIVLPVITLAFVMTAHILRITRASVIDAMHSEYVKMATLKGVPFRRVVFRHMLPSALLPTINIVALTIAWLLSGVVVIEKVFNYPGLGTLIIQSIFDRDLPLVQAIALMFALIYIAVNLIADLLVILLNPKLRSQVSGEGG